MALAGVGDLLAAVALGEHDHRPAGGLEGVDVGVHAAGGGRAERARGVALGGLGRAGVVHGMVLQVLGHRLAGVEPLLDLGVGDVAGDDQRAGEGQPGLHRQRRQLLADLGHRPVEVDPDHVAAQVVAGDVGQEPGRVALELFEEHAVGGDLGLGLAVGRARNGDGDGQRGAVSRHADDAHVVAEVLAAELGADAELLAQLQHLGLELDVAIGVAERRTLLGERVVVAGAGHLGRLERQLGRRTADDHREVVRRAGGGAERAELLVEEGEELVGREDRLGLLVQVALVGRAAALGHEQELVLRLAPSRVADLDLGGEVRLGVGLLPHRQRRHLRVTEVGGLVGVEDAPGDGLLVAASGEHALALLGLDDRRAGVLAHRQDAARPRRWRS